MPRLATIDPASAPERVKQIFDGPLKGKHLNIFKGMANSPAALDAYLALSSALSKTSLSGAEREIVQLVIARQTDCTYCEAAHTVIGKSLGLTEDQTKEARRGVMKDPKQSALARFATTLHEKRGHVSDADLAAFRKAGYTDGHIAEVVACYTLALYTNYFNHVNHTELDFPVAPAI